MTKEECKVGAQVIIRFGVHYGEVGTIYEVNDIGNNDHQYTVVDSKGFIIGCYSYLTSCDLYQADSSPNTLRSGSLSSKPLSPDCPCGILRAGCDYHK